MLEISYRALSLLTVSLQVGMLPKIKILYIASNPHSTTHLSLDEEIRAIAQKLRLSHHRDLLNIESIWAARPDDLLQALNEIQPHIVHFSGHGSETGEIILTDDSGQPQPVDASALQELFKLFKNNVKVVVLNACYSKIQAEAIAHEIGCVIGMRSQISDEAAILFASSFYRAIGFSHSIKEAYKQGCVAIQINGIPEENIPDLIVQDGLKPDEIYLFHNNLGKVINTSQKATFFEGPSGVNALEVPHFCGRNWEMDLLTKSLTQDLSPDCVVVTGLGGSGKSSLVKQWVATLAINHFPDGAIWLDCEFLSDELTRVSRHFGWNGKEDPSVKQAIQWLGQTLNNKSLLIVVDNVPTNYNQMDLHLLPIFGNRCKTIFTTRSLSLADELGRSSTLIQINEWSLEACRTYFRTSNPGLLDTSDEILDQLSSFVGRLPLAVRLLSKLLQRKGLSPVVLVRKLTQAMLLTLESQASNMDRGIATTFDESISQLSEDQFRTLLAVAACSNSTTTSVVGDLTQMVEDSVQEHLADLAEYSLLNYSAESSRPWTMHDIVRAFLRMHSNYEIFEKAHIHYVEELIQTNLIEVNGANFDQFLPEIGEAINQYSLKGYGEQAWNLIEHIQPNLIRHAKFDMLARLCQQNLILLPTNAQALGILGLCCRKLGKIKEAIEYHQSALNIHTKSRDENAKALELSRLGACYYSCDDETIAVKFFSKSLKKYEEIGDQLGVSEQLGYLALSFLMRDNFKQARKSIRRALTIDKEYGFSEKLSEHHGYLGDILRAQNDIPAALKEYTEALALDKQFYYLDLQANHIAGLGLCYRLLGDTPTAIDYLKNGILITRESGNMASLEFQLGQLGTCYRMEKDVPKAIACFEETLNISVKLGSLRSKAVALRRLGKAYRAINDIDKSLELLDQALQIEITLGNIHAQETILAYILSAIKPNSTDARIEQYEEIFRKLASKTDIAYSEKINEDEYDITEPEDVHENWALREYFRQRLGDKYSEIAFIQISREVYLDMLHGEFPILGEMIENDLDASSDLFLSYAGDDEQSVIFTLNIETANVGEKVISYLEQHKRTETHQAFLDEMKVLAERMQLVHRRWKEQKCLYFDISHTRKFKPPI